MRIKLYDIAHSRAGDKGNTLTLSLIPYQSEDYLLLKEQVTAEAVHEPPSSDCDRSSHSVRTPQFARTSICVSAGADGWRYNVLNDGYTRQEPELRAVRDVGRK